MSAFNGRSRPVRYTRLLLAAIFVISMMSFAGAAQADWVQEEIERVTTPSGAIVEGDSQFARVSANGRYVVFHTDADNIVPNFNNESWENDVYFYDRQTGDLELISVSADGEMGDGCSSKPSVSADGRYVVFQSSAENLVDNDGNDDADIFVRDRVLRTTTRVSLRMDGIAIDDQDDECANWPTISADGTTIAYRSAADDITDAVEVYYPQIWVYDMASAETTLASIATNGDFFGDDDPVAHWPSLSADGRYVAFRGNPYLADDEQETGACEPQIFVRDLKNRVTTLVSANLDNEASDGGSRWPSISGSGRYIAFQSGASDLVEDDTNDSADIFVRDLVLDETVRVSLSSDGEEGDDCSGNPAISADGRYVTFESEATNLVADDTNDAEDVFVHDMETGETVCLSAEYPSYDGSDSGFGKPSISADGLVIAFHSDANPEGYTEIEPLGEPDYGSQIYITTGVGDYVPVPVAGSNRFTTSVAASKEAFPEGADDVVLATGRNWPDALGGAALAGALDAPVLLVDTDTIPSVVSDEIKRLGADRALILGGTDAVSANVETALRKMNLSVERIGGATRYETAEMIAARTVDILGPDYDGTCFVATGTNFADALSASPLASAGGWPVYLSTRTGVSATTLAAMTAAGVTDAVLLGGDAAVTPDTDVAILKAGMTAVRIEGKSRYETAAKIAEYGVDTLGLHWNGLAITTGLDFPDALSGGVMQGRNDSVMLLTKPAALSFETRNCLESHKELIGTVRYLGGLNAVSDSVRDTVAGIVE